jgi:hypothetical protein
VLGRYFNAAPARGLVRVRVRGTFVPLTEARRLPVGTEFDARGGTVVVSAAVAGTLRGTMMASFSGAVFRLGQPAFGPNRGIANATVLDGAFAGVPAYSACHGRTPHVVQTLHANVNGRFRTTGRFSAGTVRGAAQWATSDRCDGTLTAVRRGSVLVTNPRRHARVTARGGRSYLARR